MSKQPNISIIGPGRVGTAIGVLAHRAGWPVEAVGARDATRAKAAAERMGSSVRAMGLNDAARAGELVLLTVSDRAIEGVCLELAQAGAFAAGATVAHCSGALGASVLAPASDLCGCGVGSMHPLQTFATVDRAIASMAGAYCFCEGDPRAVAILKKLAHAMGATPAELDADAKAMYHAEACIASNYIPALAAAAIGALQKAGIDAQTATAAIEPLIKATAVNVAEIGAARALTGPIARGDCAVVAGHLDAMKLTQSTDLERLYRAAGVWAVELAKNKGTIDGEAAKTLRRILDSERKD